MLWIYECRSSAPSQLSQLTASNATKRKLGEDEAKSNKSGNEWAKYTENLSKKIKNSKNPEVYDTSKFISPFRKPLENMPQNVDEKSSNNASQSHEDFLKSLTSRPFKVPIANYQPSSYSRSLGARRTGTRQPMHDPFEENALALYTPPELSASDSIKVDQLVCTFFKIWISKSLNCIILQAFYFFLTNPSVFLNYPKDYLKIDSFSIMK